MKKLLVHADGSTQGNPGEAAVGVVIADGYGHRIKEFAETIGYTTNNVAEYKALIAGCRAALSYQPEEIVLFTDSQLVARQVNGTYDIRDPSLRNLKLELVSLLERVPRWRVQHVEREANRDAHRIAKRAILEERRTQLEEARLGRELIQRIEYRLQELSNEQKEKVLDYINRLVIEG
ncbi:MAG: ribonuclease HI family protein [Candidatus Bipolaricaulia bacterium]